MTEAPFRRSPGYLRSTGRSRWGDNSRVSFSVKQRRYSAGRIATGDVKSVPVGKYAKAALEKLGAWQAAEPKFAMADSVRAALTLVARGEASLGIVYATDAKVEPGVKVVGTFPEDTHPPIIYPVAATATAKPEANDYLAYLRSSAAKAVLEKYGFTYLIRPTS